MLHVIDSNALSRGFLHDICAMQNNNTISITQLYARDKSERVFYRCTV